MRDTSSPSSVASSAAKRCPPCVDPKLCKGLGVCMDGEEPAPASLAGTPEQTGAPGFTDPKFCHKLVGDEGRYVCRFPKGHDGDCHPHLNARKVPEAFDYPAAARSLALNLAEFCDDSLAYPQMIAEAGRRAAREIEQLRLVRAGSATPASSDVLTPNAERLANIANQLERFADGRGHSDIASLRRDAAYLRSLPVPPSASSDEDTGTRDAEDTDRNLMLRCVTSDGATLRMLDQLAREREIAATQLQNLLDGCVEPTATYALTLSQSIDGSKADAERLRALAASLRSGPAVDAGTTDARNTPSRDPR